VSQPNTFQTKKNLKRGTKTLVIDGVEPIAANAKKFTYARLCYLYAPDKPSAEADAFMKYVESSAGQDIVRKVGFIPVADL
jgi:phosphate transport system substrate-binding protein